MHIMELHGLYTSPDKSVFRIKLRRVEWSGHVAYIGKKRNTYKVMVKKKAEGKRPLVTSPLVTSRHRWEHNSRGSGFIEIG